MSGASLLLAAAALGQPAYPVDDVLSAFGNVCLTQDQYYYDNVGRTLAAWEDAAERDGQSGKLLRNHDHHLLTGSSRQRSLGHRQSQDHQERFFELGRSESVAGDVAGKAYG